MNSTNTFSYDSLIAAFLAGTNDAYLVLNHQYRIIMLNKNYIAFHQQYAFSVPDEGTMYIPSIQGTLLHFLIEHIQESFVTSNVKKFCHKIQSDTEKYFDIEVHPLPDKEGKITAIALGFFDVTKRYIVANEIQRSEKLFKALVTNATDAFQLTNDELKITYISDSVKNVLGYDSSELLNNYFFNLVHPDDKIIISKWLQQILDSSNITHTTEMRVRNKHKEWIYIEIAGRNLSHIPEIGAIVMNYRNIQNKKVAEKALAMAEQRMSLLLNNTKESFIVVNSRLRIVTYNRAAQEHSPYFFIDELQSGVSLLSLIKEQEIESTINLFEKVFEGLEGENETSFVDAKNVLHLYRHSFRPLFSENEIVGVFITSTDITEKKKAELQLKESEERNRTIIQESFDAMIICNNNYVITEASPVVFKVLGYHPEELVGRRYMDIIHDSNNDEHIQHIRAVSEKFDNEINLDTLILHKSGNYVWVSAKIKNLFHNPLINGLIFMITDISNRKNAETQVLLSEQRFKKLVQSGADMISILSKEGIVQYSSPTVENVLGNDPEKDIGRNIFNYIHPNDKGVILNQFNEMVQQNTNQTFFGPFRFLNAAGQYRWIETVATNLSEDPAINGIIINSRDVTERKKLNDKQKALTGELIKKNEDLQQFSFITSHNLRAPVANLIGLLNLFNKQDYNDPFNETLLEKFEEATNQLSNTLNDLIEVLVLKSNKDTPLEKIELTEFTQKIILSIEKLVKEQEVVITTDFSIINIIKSNKIYLKSVFQNLISNAIKYRSKHRKPVIHISTKKIDEWVVISFTDNGIGIDLKKYKDRIFGMYQRFHIQSEGKGLGLYMVKAQIIAMGGKIEVESEIGETTTFKVYLKHNDKI
ncbi:MAG: PAS domain-containing sensor histidine kinase [Chitinophagaceae bacterium]|nr:PAS domain-containing sensor histidine kinase [Chitinophagaceae bacterium]